MSSLLNKLADHPQATADPTVNPAKGVDGASGAIRDDNDPARSETQNWIAKGQGGERTFGNDEHQVRAGSLSSPDTSTPAHTALPTPERVRELEASLKR